MTTYIEGTLVNLCENGLLGILTSDHMVYELGQFQGIEYLGQDGTWKEANVFVSAYEGWDILDENEYSVLAELGMPVRYKVWQSDEGLKNIPDGIDDELPECFLK